MSISVQHLTDRATVRAYLNRDRKLTAYALGDLDDAFWPQSTYVGAYRSGEMIAIMLLYRGLDPTVVTAFGDPDGVRALFERADMPDEIYYLMPPELEPILHDHYACHNPHREWRMVLDPGAFGAELSAEVTRIGPADVEALTTLYRQAAHAGEVVVAFSPWQIEHGAFYGIWQDGLLLATAGTHVWSPAEGIAAIGNVFTHPAQRGHGYATLCTAAVVREALAAGLDTVVLNVRQNNDPAIRVYEKLGFDIYATFFEGPAVRRV